MTSSDCASSCTDSSEGFIGAVPVEYDAQSLAVSQGVAAQYQMIAEAYGLRFLDAGTVTQMSALDGEHLDPDGHKKLAAAIADIVRRDCEA